MTMLRITIDRDNPTGTRVTFTLMPRHGIMWWMQYFWAHAQNAPQTVVVSAIGKQFLEHAHNLVIVEKMKQWAQWVWKKQFTLLSGPCT